MFVLQYAPVEGISDEELLAIPESDYQQDEALIESGDPGDNLSVVLESGTMVFPDGREIPFTAYHSTVVSTYRSLDGDRWFILADGGHINVSYKTREIRRAVDDARRRAELDTEKSGSEALSGP